MKCSTGATIIMPIAILLICTSALLCICPCVLGSYMCVITDFVFQVRNQGLSVDYTNSVLFWIWIFFFFWSAASASKENICSAWVEKSSELLDKIISYIAAEMCEWAGGGCGGALKTTGNQIRIQKSWINRSGCAATLYTTLQPFEPNTLLADKTANSKCIYIHTFCSPPQIQ